MIAQIINNLILRGYKSVNFTIFTKKVWNSA